MKKYNLSKLDIYFYVFRKDSMKLLEREYNKSNDRINFYNIRNFDKLYSSFINKLLYLFYNSKKSAREINNIRYLLQSKNLMDRLKGLKLSHKYIKIVGDDIDNTKRNSA